MLRESLPRGHGHDVQRRAAGTQRGRGGRLAEQGSIAFRKLVPATVGTGEPS